PAAPSATDAIKNALRRLQAQQNEPVEAPAASAAKEAATPETNAAESPAVKDASAAGTSANGVSAGNAPKLAGQGKRILIIEDDQAVGEIFRLALEQEGYAVTVVNDVTKALGVVFQGMPDAIVLDLLVPDANGLDLVRYVRKQK